MGGGEEGGRIEHNAHLMGTKEKERTGHLTRETVVVVVVGLTNKLTHAHSLAQLFKYRALSQVHFLQKIGEEGKSTFAQFGGKFHGKSILATSRGFFLSLKFFQSSFDLLDILEKLLVRIL